MLSHGEPRDAAVNFDTYRILQVDDGTFMYTYAKYGKLVDADASGAKASKKHLDSRLEVIQGLTFILGSPKGRRGTAYYCIMMWAF